MNAEGGSRRRRDRLALPATALALLAREVAVQLRALGPERALLEHLGLDVAGLPGALEAASDALRRARSATARAGAQLLVVQDAQRARVAEAVRALRGVRRKAVWLVRYRDLADAHLVIRAVDEVLLDRRSVPGTLAVLTATLGAIDRVGLPADPFAPERAELATLRAALDADAAAEATLTHTRARLGADVAARRAALVDELRGVAAAWRVVEAQHPQRLPRLRMNEALWAPPRRRR